MLLCKAFCSYLACGLLVDDRTLGEEGPPGSDRLGLEKGRARVKRLSDDEFSSSKCTWGKGAGTQEIGVIQSGIQAETQLFGETGNSAVARTGSGVGWDG